MNYQDLKGILATEPNMDDRSVWIKVDDKLYPVVSVEREAAIDGDGIWLNADINDPQSLFDEYRENPTRIRTAAHNDEVTHLFTQVGIFDAKLKGITLNLKQYNDHTWYARIEELDWNFRGSKKACCKYALATLLQAFADHLLHGEYPDLKGRVPTLNVEDDVQ